MSGKSSTRAVAKLTGVALGMICTLPAVCRAQPFCPANTPRTLLDPLVIRTAAPMPAASGAYQDKQASESDGTAVPITLPTALRLSQIANLDVAQARAVVAQAQLGVRRADIAWLPNINLGSEYDRHDGNIQKTEGNIIKANRDSLFFGGGPTATLQLSDIIFGPLIARQVRAASVAGRQRVSNDTLLAVADAYFALLRARRRIARVEETLDYLISENASATRANSKGLLPLVRDFVDVGKREALKSDLARVEVEVLRRDEERVAAVQEFRIASADLARLLRLDPATILWPAEDFRFPVPLPGEEWLSRPVEELVGVALMNRPELAESQALIRAAVDRVRAAQYRPLVPTFAAGYSFGDFGGDPALLPNGKFGTSGQILSVNTRTDFAVGLTWRLQNFGLGNRAEIREQRVVQQQATIRNQQIQDNVAAQVVQTREAVLDWSRRLGITRSALFDAQGKAAGPVFHSLQLNFERIRGAEGRPLEVLDSIRGFSDVLESYGQATTDYERSRFRLLINLGLPAQEILDSLCPATPVGK